MVRNRSRGRIGRRLVLGVQDKVGTPADKGKTRHTLVPREGEKHTYETGEMGRSGTQNLTRGDSASQEKAEIVSLRNWLIAETVPCTEETG